MKVDWKGLTQGIYNAVLGKQWIKDLAAYRMNTYCSPCEFNSKNAIALSGYTTIRPDHHCTRCGCNLEWKTHQLSSSCPVSKWQAEVSQEQANEITKQLSNGAKEE
ncbi:hypothetical protein SAMN05428988_3203 [Chitinophaga sp. YR573]|uniref:hypothetical protein n=1 Tax=Chitinophaga sp. YR573 TaxID=1881040 RepID=UPI0008D1DB30|nr:hypothetical protein [Chitinophaga sp. YR573]SEW21367.1 hypothetical protein SAMN05428988_3203 [Chitinophaga sp. YR573]